MEFNYKRILVNILLVLLILNSTITFIAADDINLAMGCGVDNGGTFSCS